VFRMRGEHDMSAWLRHHLILWDEPLLFQRFPGWSKQKGTRVLRMNFTAGFYDGAA